MGSLSSVFAGLAADSRRFLTGAAVARVVIAFRTHNSDDVRAGARRRSRGARAGRWSDTAGPRDRRHGTKRCWLRASWRAGRAGERHACPSSVWCHRRAVTVHDGPSAAVRSAPQPGGPAFQRRATASRQRCAELPWRPLEHASMSITGFRWHSPARLPSYPVTSV